MPIYRDVLRKKGMGANLQETSQERGGFGMKTYVNETLQYRIPHDPMDCLTTNLRDAEMDSKDSNVVCN